ncbi:hypothetical protein RUND412_009567 [Rhizina undulata]
MTESTYLTSLFSLAGKTVLITGGTRGIGSELTLALASAGADIVLLERGTSSPESWELKEKITALGRNIWSYKCDLAVREEVLAAVGKVLEGGRQVDVLVNCAGLSIREKAELFSIEDWDHILNVNLSASFILSRDIARNWLSETEKGIAPPWNRKIINIASVLTFTGSVETPAYAASKGAIGQLTKALSNEWSGRGINVNAIAPGYIRTQLTKAFQENEDKSQQILNRTPMGRWGNPEDLAGAVVYLASRASDFVTGEIHVVDGGYCGR